MLRHAWLLRSGVCGIVGLCLLAAAAPARADFAAGAAAYQEGDYAAARADWTAAADAGDARSQLGLGVLCETGRGLPAPDLPQAVVWYRAAAAQGLPAAQNNLALLYARGRGVQLNPVTASELWQVAATAGYPPAQFNLALAYEQGFGVARDYVSAARWYAEAGNRGVGDAAFALSEYYRTGRGDVPRHAELAKLWLDVARKFGSTRTLRTDFWASTPAPPAPKNGAAAKPETGKAAAPSASAAKPRSAAPAQAETTAKTAAPAQSAPPARTEANAQAAPPAAAPAADHAGRFVLQLASLPSQAEAAQASADLKTRYADLLGALDVTIHRADLGAAKGVWYRVFAGPLAGHDDAVHLCERLRAAAHPTDCFVMTLK